MNIAIPITFITPCFCRGADCSDNGAPEIRPASIRGQLHWWFRALGGTSREENAVFGNVHGGTTASRLVVRVKYVMNASYRQSPTLPHKTGGPAAPKQAFAPGVGFELLLSTRLGGLSTDHEKKLLRALNAWLHLGALGLRATRGGGNFTWAADAAAASGVQPPPTTAAAYTAAVATITNGTMLRAALLDKQYPNAEDARKDITNTLGDGAFGGAAPLGKAGRERKTSPLRFRVVKFGDGNFRIAAVWDGRSEVTGNTDADLRDAIEKLRLAGKPVGVQLSRLPFA